MGGASSLSSSASALVPLSLRERRSLTDGRSWYTVSNMVLESTLSHAHERTIQQHCSASICTDCCVCARVRACVHQNENENPSSHLAAHAERTASHLRRSVKHVEHTATNHQHHDGDADAHARRRRRSETDEPNLFAENGSVVCNRPSKQHIDSIDRKLTQRLELNCTNQL